jgi:hypothetical protein
MCGSSFGTESLAFDFALSAAPKKACRPPL